MLWSSTILGPDDPMYAYKWEKVGYRAAWVSVTQIPFVYLLACKFNPISILTGISYERSNWLHRWVARTVFLTVIVHWAYFFTEWSLASFVKLELDMMPMVKYGFGAWAVLGWMVITGFGFVRALSYEVWVAQHILGFVVLLWLVWVHVPAYAQYNVWLSVAFIVFDWSARTAWALYTNLHLLRKTKPRLPGYLASTRILPGDMVLLTLEDVDFDWTAGQHVYLSIPSVRPLELHPFTIANSPHITSDSRGRQATMLIKAHSGFSRSLHTSAVKDAATSRQRRAFVSGPWGTPPSLSHYETVVLIACSTGASFVVPLLQDLVRRRGCVEKIHVHWIIRSREYLCWFERDLSAAVDAARLTKLRLEVTVHITQDDVSSSALELSEATKQMRDPTTVSLHSGSVSSDYDPSAGNVQPSIAMRVSHGARPSVQSMVRPPVEAALGETAVITCGGLSITAQTRSYVASLSDERAVHKGSGAQGIFLFTETYGS